MPAIEFALDPADIDALARLDSVVPSRAYPTALVWFDTPARDLTAMGLALVTRAGRWQLSPLHAPNPSDPTPVLAEAGRPDRLVLAHPHLALPDLSGLRPIARLDGRRQSLRQTVSGTLPGTDAGAGTGGDNVVAIRLLHGQLTAPVGSTSGRNVPQPVCRLHLEGDAAALAAVTATLAATLRLHVPTAGLSELALATPAPALPLGAPRIHHGQSVSDSLALIIGHLAAVIAHWAGRITAVSPARARTRAAVFAAGSTAAGSTKDPEPVHQMRVATRRLRSALSVYRPAVPSPALAGLAVPLKLCAARLGVAREWDVFLGGLGARLTGAFPDDPRCRAMMRAAARRRRAAYHDLRAYLAGPDFRCLTVALACAARLHPWQEPPPSEQSPALSQDTAIFASQVLARRLRHVRRAGRHLDALPVPALHELRKDCKRLRYAAEFFASLFPPRRTARFLARLSALQEELGLLNDGAAVAGLMAQLGRTERGFAAGLAEGFSAAQAAPARGRIEHAWKRFRTQTVFWKT